MPDASPRWNATLLYLESMRRRSVANDEKVQLGHRGVMNLVRLAGDEQQFASGANRASQVRWVRQTPC